MGATSWARLGFFWATNRAAKKCPRLGSKRAHQDIFWKAYFYAARPLQGPSRHHLGPLLGFFWATNKAPQKCLRFAWKRAPQDTF